MDANVSSDEVEATPQEAIAPPNRAIWSVLTALPGLSSIAWLWLACRTRSTKYIVSAAIYFLWPTVAVVIGAIFVVVTEIDDWENDWIVALAMTIPMWIASLVNAQREWSSLRRNSAAPLNRPPRQSYFLCYLLWLLLGWAGGHRFYAGRWTSGLLYACTFGLLGFGWAVDLFLLNGMVADAHARTPAGDTPTGLAAWASEPRRFARLERSGPFLFFLFGPLFFVTLAVMVKQYELLAVMVVVIVLCGLLDNVERVSKQLDALRKVPILGSALEVFHQFHEFYLHNRPRSFFFYLCYPLTGPIAAQRSGRDRDELWMYLKVLKPIMLVVAVQQVMTYTSVYPPHLTVEDAFVRLFVLAFFALFTTVVFLVPTVTTSFTLNLSGRKYTLKFLSILALAVALPMGVYVHYGQATQISFLGFDLLGERLNKESFRDELREVSEMFLAYHIDRTVDGSTSGLKLNVELTEKFRRHVAGLASGDEPNAFEVFAVSNSPHESWLGIRIRDGFAGDPAEVLFLMSPHRRLYTRWEELPPMVRGEFRVVRELPEEEPERPEFIASAQLLGDRY